MIGGYEAIFSDLFFRITCSNHRELVYFKWMYEGHHFGAKLKWLNHQNCLNTFFPSYLIGMYMSL